MHTRDDRVVIVKRPDGSVIVEHADGTRITTVYSEAVNNEKQAEEGGKYSNKQEIWKKSKKMILEFN